MARPVLQIVHISDLHFHVGAAPQHDALIRGVVRRIARVAPQYAQWLLHYWEDGRAGHATDALVAFECFLTGQPLPTEPPGTGTYTSGVSYLDCRVIPTWLVDTGDLASVGDAASVRQEVAWVDKIGALLGDNAPIRLYGNHDAWPDKFPLIASSSDLGRHRNGFRTNFFPKLFPLPYRSVPLGATGHQIDLYGLNSIIHDRNYNGRARGEIRRDAPWSRSPRDQLPALAAAVQQRAHSLGSKKAFRILLTHHPIHHPAPVAGGTFPSWTMSLRDASGVARQLLLPGLGPAGHLVLSGHTHELFPGVGSLPANAGYASHSPLGNHQLQLIAGSLSKAVRGSTAAYDIRTEPHQCQVLRFYEVPGQPDTVLLRRAVVGRNNGTGRFRFMPSPSNGQVWEDCYLNF